MTTIRQWVRKYMSKGGHQKRRIYSGIRNQMKEDNSFDAKWWDTVVTETAWKVMLKEALK